VKEEELSAKHASGIAEMIDNPFQPGMNGDEGQQRLK